MRNWMISICLLASIPTFAQYGPNGRYHSAPSAGLQVDVVGAMADREFNNIQAEGQYNWEYVKSHWLPLDPYRKIGTNIFFARSDGWLSITGAIIKYPTNSILISGKYGIPFGDSIPADENAIILITNFPYIAAGRQISFENGIVAKFMGMTVEKGQSVVWFDYGKVYYTPTNLLIEAALKKKHEQDVKTFNSLFSAAKNGERWAQCSLGECYLTGKGCETNFDLANQWLKKAAEQGSIEASNRLASLNH